MKWAEEIIYHNECCCLFADNVMSDKCHKRYYEVTNWKTGRKKRIFICNDLIRLKLNREREDIGNSRWTNKYDVDQIIQEIISNYVDCNNRYFGSKGNDLTDRKVIFNVCERPHLTHSVYLLDAIKFYLTCENYNEVLYQSIKETILRYMENLTYKKYKTKYKSIKIKIKKMHYTYLEERKQLMNEIITEIFETQYKLKK